MLRRSSFCAPLLADWLTPASADASNCARFHSMRDQSAGFRRFAVGEPELCAGAFEQRLGDEDAEAEPAMLEISLLGRAGIPARRVVM